MYVAMIKYDPIGFLILPIFFLGIIFFSGLIYYLSGWFKLSREYPLSSEVGAVIKIFRWRSININYIAAYRSLIDVMITEKGIVIKPSLKIFILHKPIFLMWKQLAQFNYRGGILKRVVFRVSNKRISMYGAVAKEIFVQKSRRMKESKGGTTE